MPLKLHHPLALHQTAVPQPRCGFGFDFSSFGKLLASAVLAVGVLGLAPSAATAAPSAEAQVLNVGTEASFAPFSFKEGNEMRGFDIDVMEAVAKEMGMQVKWSPMAFDGVIQALLTNQLDMACASISVTKERAERVDFTIPYYTTGLTFIIRTADKDKYPTVASIKGQKIGAQLGSVSSLKGEEFSPGNVVNFDSMALAYIDLKAGGTEAALNDSAANKYMLRTSNVADGLMEVNELLNATKIAMAVPKGHPDLVQKLNEGIRTIKANGVYAEIYQKWFGTKPPATEFEE